jgi:hypothetical protein
MQELVDRIASSANLTPDVARKALGVVLAFISREAPDGPVKKLLDAIPGSREMLESEGEGGTPNMVGYGSMGAMGTFNELTGMGLSLHQIQTLARETMAFGREHAGEDTMSDIIAGVPGLDQIL